MKLIYRMSLGVSDRVETKHVVVCGCLGRITRRGRDCHFSKGIYSLDIR